MKIGIATFHWSDNYGAVLQAYALQHYLRNMYSDVEIIDYRPFRNLPWYKRIIAKSPKRLVRKMEHEYKRLKFEKFRDKHLICTKNSYSTIQSLKEEIHDYDVLITGSDQVWNPTWLSQNEEMIDFYFLSFGTDSTKRYSYAASVGHSDLSTIKPDWQKLFKEKLNDIDKISVREVSSIDLLNSMCGRSDVVSVVDPTLLLSNNHYKSLINRKRKRNNEMMCYMLHGRERDADNYVEILRKELELNTVYCNATKTGIHKDYSLPSPENWLKMIHDASYVVTNSFHGVVYCIIFRTSFIAISIGGIISTMNSRIRDLLEEIGLSNRFCSPNQKIEISELFKPINWDEVEEKLQPLISESKLYLDRILKL